MPIRSAVHHWIWLSLGAAALGCSDAWEPAVETSRPPTVRGQSGELHAIEHWPGWRGAHAGGVRDEFRLPEVFNGSEGYSWKVELSGEGNSSPIVWNDRIVLTAASENATGSGLEVLCFDRESGAMLWRRTAAAATGQTHAKNGHASATPATDGERIFVSFGSAGLFCFDFEGELLWRASLGELKHMWGTASSPVLYGDLVLQLCDHEQGSYLAAFHTSSGELVWRTERSSFGSWSTPVLVDAHDRSGLPRQELVVNGTGTDDPRGGFVIGYDPLDGRELWRVQGTTDIVCPTLLVGDGLVVSTSGRNGPIFAIRPGGRGDVTSTHVVWRHRRGGPYVPSGVIYRNRVYTVTDNGLASCHDAASGERLWQARLGGSFTASLVAGDRKIYATSETGTVHVFAATDAFEPIAENALHERCLATPALARGALIVRTQRHLVHIPGPAPLDTLAGDEGDEEDGSPIDGSPATSQVSTASDEQLAEQAVETFPVSLDAENALIAE